MNPLKLFANFLAFFRKWRLRAGTEGLQPEASQLTSPVSPDAAARNVRLYPWYRFFQNLIFWQAVWFLFFQETLSATEAILLYAVYDVATTVLEVPSGYLSDRLGRRPTLRLAALAALSGSGLIALGDGFAVFALGQVLLGAASSFASGTDSALLFESLEADGRQDEVEAQEVRAWRFGFAALALSAAVGGVMALLWDRLPFLASVLAGAGLVVVTLKFGETRPWAGRHATTEPDRARSLMAALKEPVLLWLLILSVSMYGLSHVPFVFGQPFILEALGQYGWSGEAPAVSGMVSAAMMLVSVAVSWVAVEIRARIGLMAVLMVAFGMQVGLVAGLSLTGSVFAIGLLLLRMVPNSLSTPFITARVQPLLDDDSRATFLSIKSLIGRLAFAATLWLASGVASPDAPMSHTQIQVVMMSYAIGGSVIWFWLVFWGRRLNIEPQLRP